MFREMDFRGKGCIVTGGARGIGKEITEALLKRGAKCLLVDVLYKATFALDFSSIPQQNHACSSFPIGRRGD